MRRIFVRYRWFWLVVILALAVDLVTKDVIFDRLGLSDADVHAAVERGWERYERDAEALAEWEAQHDAAETDPAGQPPEPPHLYFGFEHRHQHEIVPDYLYFTAVLNPGAFGGLLGGHVLILLALSLAAVLIVGWILLRSTLPRYQIVGGLIIAGALGNMYDRFVFGAVRDFVDFRLPEAGVAWLNPWNTFNFADSIIVGGILALLLIEFLFPLPDPRRAEKEATAAPADEADASDPEPATAEEKGANPAG